MRVTRTLMGIALGGSLLAAACNTGANQEVVAPDVPQKPAGAGVTQNPAASPAAKTASPVAKTASPSPSPGANTLTFAGITYNDHGTATISGDDGVPVQVANYYFEPTFLRGSQAERATLRIRNTSSTLHNFSMLIPAQRIDRDITPNETVEVEVVFPQSGTFQFYCKYHINQGMNGQLMSPQATPQVPTSVDVPPTR